MPKQKHWSKRKFGPKRSPANQVSDPLMGMLREKGTYIKPAEKEKKQFLNLVSKGPNRYVDDEMAMLIFGAADEYTMQLVDNVADQLSKIVNLGNKKIKGRDLAPEEEVQWGDAIREFRDIYGHEFESADAFGRHIANFAGVLTPKAWAQGLFGLAGSVIHKHGLKKGVKVLSRFGEKAAQAVKAGKALDKDKVKSIWTTLGEGLEKVPGSSIFQGAKVGAEAALYNVASEDEMAKWDKMSTGLAALAGGSFHKLAKAGKRATEILPRAEKELRERANEISWRLNLNEKTRDRLRQVERSFLKNPKKATKSFKDFLEDIYSNSYAFRDVAIDALKSNKFDIPVSKIAIPVKGQIKSIVLPNLSKGERWIFMALLDQDFNTAKAVQGLENFMTKKMKGKNREQFKKLLSPSQLSGGSGIETAVNNVLEKYEALMNQNPNSAQASVLKELERYRDLLHKSPLFQQKIKNPAYNPNGVGDQLNKETRVASEYQVRNIVNGLNQKADFNKELAPGANSEYMARFGQTRHDVNEYLKKKNPVFSDFITRSSSIKEVLEGSPRKKTRGVFELFEVTPLGRARGDSPGFGPILGDERKTIPDFVGRVNIDNPEATETILREVVFGNRKSSSEAAKSFKKLVSLFDPNVSEIRYKRMAKNVEKAMLTEALTDPKAAQAILDELQDDAANLTKSILKKEELPEEGYPALGKLIKTVAVSSGAGYAGGAQFGPPGSELKVAILTGITGALREIQKNQNKAGAKAFFKGGDAYEGLKDIMLLEDQIKDVQKAYASGDWSQVNNALRTWGVGNQAIDKVSRKMAKTKDWAEKMPGLKGDILRGGIDTVGRMTRAAPIQRTIKGQELGEKREGRAQEEEVNTMLNSFGDAPVDTLSDDNLERSPQAIEETFPPVQESIFTPEKETLRPEEFSDRSQARGEFLEPEEIEETFTTELQDPEAKDREMRSERINSFLKQQGAYKRSKRRRQIG